MKLVLLALCATLCGCAMTDNLATYDARVEAGGQVVKVHNKHGAYLELEETTNGVTRKVIADDRGHPAEQGTFDKLVDFATVTAAGKVGD